MYNHAIKENINLRPYPLAMMGDLSKEEVEEVLWTNVVSRRNGRSEWVMFKVIEVTGDSVPVVHLHNNMTSDPLSHHVIATNLVQLGSRIRRGSLENVDRCQARGADIRLSQSFSITI